MPKKMTNEEFNNKIIEKFNNEIECLDEFISYRVSKNMRFRCKRNKLHDEIYTISAQNILRTKGSGCPFCDNQLKTNSMVEESLRIKFGERIKLKEKWDYNLNKVNNKTTFICSVHGEFESNLNILVNGSKGHGCKKCSIENTGNIKLTRSLELIKQKLKDTDITLKEETFTGVSNNAIFNCPKHGDFRRIPGKILYSNRITCPYCNISNGEAILIRILEELGLELNKDFIHHYYIEDLKYKRNLEIDICILNKNIMIEFDGKQHYDKSSYFYDEEQILRDSIKDEYCKTNNIKLVRFIDDSKDITEYKINIIKQNLVRILKEDECSTTIEKIKLF